MICVQNSLRVQGPAPRGVCQVQHGKTVWLMLRASGACVGHFVLHDSILNHQRFASSGGIYLHEFCVKTMHLVDSGCFRSSSWGINFGRSDDYLV